MTALQHDTVQVWDGPAAVAPRGTLIVVPGRGEHGAVYERFGRRLAFDGYRVRAIDDPTRDPAGAADAIAELLTDDELPAPRVLVGSDAGALFAIAQAGQQRGRVDALVLAGLLTDAAATAPAEEAEPIEELAARTACPTHQARLRDDTAFEAGALHRAAPREWFAAADLAAVDVPVLGLHGEADVISPVGAARAAYDRAPSATLVTVAGGRHDALNDATHRTAAATVVLFLERLRLGADLPVIARSST